MAKHRYGSALLPQSSDLVHQDTWSKLYTAPSGYLNALWSKSRVITKRNQHARVDQRSRRACVKRKSYDSSARRSLYSRLER